MARIFEFEAKPGLCWQKISNVEVIFNENTPRTINVHLRFVETRQASQRKVTFTHENPAKASPQWLANIQLDRTKRLIIPRKYFSLGGLDENGKRLL